MKRILSGLLAVAALAAPVFAGSSPEAARAKTPLTWAWFPNESVPEFAGARSAIIDLVSTTLGREIIEQATTDYAIAIEALVNDNAAFSWFGGEAYVQAHARNAKILPLVTNSPSETLDNAKYYSMVGVLTGNAPQ